jgi:hypothetical protein
VVLLVQGIQDLRVGEGLVEALAGVHPRVVGQAERELPHGPELLDLDAPLMQPWLAAE